VNLAERLRGVVRSGGSASPNPPYARRPGSAESSEAADPVCVDDAAETLGGEWRDGRYLVVDLT
jgi:hypothetical protein